jgi:cell division protein FtsL
MSKAINDSLNLTISISFLVKIILAVGVFAGGFYSVQMRITDLERTVAELHTEVTVLNQKMANMEKEHVKELEEENRSLMQKLGLKKP